MKRIAFYACLTFTVLAPVSAFAYPSCEQAPANSPTSSLPITMTFRNVSDQPLQLDWVDFQGRLKSYGMVGPGQTKTQQTFEGHVWQWTVPGGGCVNRYVAGKQNVQ